MEKKWNWKDDKKIKLSRNKDPNATLTYTLHIVSYEKIFFFSVTTYCTYNAPGFLALSLRHIIGRKLYWSVAKFSSFFTQQFGAKMWR